MNFLGLDFGTTSLKAAVFNKAGECPFTHEITYELIHHDGFIELNADEYFRMLLSVIIRLLIFSIFMSCDRYTVRDNGTCRRIW
jgi:sugar (pentulose or hexulose) kinase